MKNESIPFNPFPMPLLLKISENFGGLGFKVSKAFPTLDLELQQAEIHYSAKEYGSMMVVISAFYFLAGALIAGLICIRLAPKLTIFAAPTFGALAAIMIFAQLTVFPKIKVKKKVRDVEKHLVFALRTILIEIKSSVTLFDALQTIAIGNFGEISKEVKKTIEKIATGTIEDEALDELAVRNPSLFFRRAIWQIVNGLKAGADISSVLSTIVGSLANEQKTQVKLYGAALKLLSLVYMMIGVIVPALGLTLLIILSTFPQIKIQEIYFWVMLALLIVGQFMYLGMIKSKRPNLIGD